MLGSGEFWGEAGKAIGSHCGPTAAAGELQPEQEPKIAPLNLVTASNN